MDQGVKMTILFDLDGTLIDSTDAILQSFYHAFEAKNFPSPTQEAIKALIGYPLDTMFIELGVEETRAFDFVESYKEKYREISTPLTTLLPHAKESIYEAKKFARLGVVTTKTARYSRILLEHFGIMEHFDVLIGREDVLYPKPHAEPIHKAIEYLGAHGDEVWMIGDTKLDILSAQNAGIQAVAVLSGYDTKETLERFTNMISSDALEAIHFIAKSRK